MQFFASFCRKTAGFYLLYHAVKAFAIQETGFFTVALFTGILTTIRLRVKI